MCVRWERMRYRLTIQLIRYAQIPSIVTLETSIGCSEPEDFRILVAVIISSLVSVSRPIRRSLPIIPNATFPMGVRGVRKEGVNGHIGGHDGLEPSVRWAG